MTQSFKNAKVTQFYSNLTARNKPWGHVSSKKVEITHFACRLTHEIQAYRDGFCYWPNVIGEKGKDIQYDLPAEEIKISVSMEDKSACDMHFCN